MPGGLLATVAHMHDWKKSVHDVERAKPATSMANRHGFNVIRTFPPVGHGIGREHNDGWFIPWRVGGLNDGRVLQKGMTFSVEVYLTPGSERSRS